MGFALALEFAERGANVELVSGPVSLLADHPRIHLTKVTAAAEMHRECLRLFGACNVAVMAAAIADFTPEHAESGKIKKQSDTMTLQLKRTTDVLNELGKKKKENQILAGFALETDNEIENARLKLKNKNLDLIVLNSLKDEGAGFGFDTNKISILTKNGEITQFGVKLKREAARDIADKINELLIKSGKENQ